MLKKIKVSKFGLLCFLYIALIAAGVSKTYIIDSIDTATMPVEDKNIVIDAGHGGWDPGKVRADGIKEKDVNLEISKKLQQYLEQGGAFVLTTRTDDSALSEKKRVDLKARKEIAADENVDMFISVHQNSFPKSSVKGAQVFYYSKSEESKLLAEKIQSRIKEVADSQNERVAKPNSEYYLLKQSKIPSVIVECGFLSNDDENAKLHDEEYQSRIAWAIYMGIMDYFSKDTAEI